jgi:Zn-dependent protease/CBS domain-containing protein
LFFKRITIFHFFGFEVRADASWVFLSIFVFWTFSNNMFPIMFPGLTPNDYQWMALSALAGLMFSIVGHEVAHAVIAEYYHMPISNITLFIFGGVAEMNGEPSHPKGEFLMAIAGPVMSALLGLFFYAWANLYELYVEKDPIYHVLGYLGLLNMQIAVFNMVPAFPLDGGRALRALIWQFKKNFVIATRISSQMGAAFAYGLLGLACYRIIINDNLISGAWISILGLFIHAAGTSAVYQSESRSLLRQEDVSRFMQDNVVPVSPDLTINDLVDTYVAKHYQRSFPVIDNGKLVGIITLQSVLSLARHKWPWLHVASVMSAVSDKNTVTTDHNAADALDLMQRLKLESLLVTDSQGGFRGVVHYRDLVAYLSITMKIDQDRPVSLSR